MKTRFPLTLCAVACAFAPSLRAEILTMAVAEDTSLNASSSSYFASANWGGMTNGFISPFADTFSLMRFDTSGIGVLAGATIHSVTLSLTASVNNVGTTSGAVGHLMLSQVAAANSGWIEGTGNGPGSFTGDGSSNYYIQRTSNGDPGTGNAWAAGGNFAASGAPVAGNITTSYSLGSFANQTLVVGQTYQFTLDSALITGWVNSNTLATAGVTVWLGNGSWWNWNALGFHTSESETAAFRPTITVDYTAVPEPGAALFAMLGGALLLKRSRRNAGREISSC